MQRLGSRYLLHDQIGQGGMGVVWRGQDVHTGNWLAIKLLKPELAANPASVARFIGERNALIRFRHPNVVTLRDMVVEGDQLALVMDLVVGGDLDTFRQHHGGTLAPGIAAGLTAQICAGLAAAHEAGIVHRDLKPANVLLDNGRVRLADFGIALIPGEAGSAARLNGDPAAGDGMVMGTARYLAPELISGGQASPASDVYAVGITLYELLAGQPPFTGHVGAVMQAHLHQAPRRPPGMPDRLWATIAACLSKDPGARPAADDLADAMRQAVIDTGDLPAAVALFSPAPAPPARPGPATTKRRPGPRAGAVLLGGGRAAGIAALAIASIGVAAAAAYRIGLESRTTTGGHPPGATAAATYLAHGSTPTASPTRHRPHPAQGTAAQGPATHPSSTVKPRRAATRPHPKPAKTTPAPAHTSGSPAPPATSPPPVSAWQCGPAGPASLASGKDAVRLSGERAAGQTIQACIRINNGQLQLQGTLTGADPIAKEQISLVLKDSAGAAAGTFTSPVCTTATCTFSISITPAAGSWTVVPQWLADGVYESSGASTPAIAFSAA